MNISRTLGSLKLFKQAYAKHKNKVIVMAVLGLAGGFFGGIGIGAVIPLFSLIINKGSFPGNDRISHVVSRLFVFFHIKYSLPYLLVFMGLLFVLKAVFLYIANYINQRMTFDYEEETRKELFKRSLEAGWPYLLQQKVGHLTVLLTDNVYNSAALLTGLSTILLTLTSLVTYSLVAITISAVITLAVLGVGLVIFLAFKPLFHIIRRLSGNAIETTKAIAHHVSQYMIGAKTVKTMAVEEAVATDSNEHFRRLRDTRLKLSKYNIVLNTFFEPITFLIVVPILLFSYKKPDFNIISFGAILYLVQKIFTFIQSVQIRLNAINSNIPNLKSVLEHQALAAKYLEKSINQDSFVFRNNMEFRNVTFRYNQEREILSGFNMNLRKGESVGLIGPSGAGKTTVVDLLLRLFEPASGKILIDGQEITGINLFSLRRHIGYVSQDIFLLNDTIENNIKFYDEKITEGRIIEAAKVANIYEFIRQQPDGLQTLVGERGLQLSAGQRQRIVLARVLARRPELLLLDEATSALDNESELAIQRSVSNLHGKVTMLIIAHRLSTVMKVDRIMVLDKGKIIEEGVPEELLSNQNSYFRRVSLINK